MLPDREMTMQECADYLRKVIREHEKGHGKKHTFYCMEEKKRYDVVLTPKNDYIYQVYTTALKCIEGFTDEELIRIAMERGFTIFPNMTVEAVEKALDGSDRVKVNP